jgi:hypothetical protein
MGVWKEAARRADTARSMIEHGKALEEFTGRKRSMIGILFVLQRDRIGRRRF